MNVIELNDPNNEIYTWSIDRCFPTAKRNEFFLSSTTLIRDRSGSNMISHTFTKSLILNLSTEPPTFSRISAANFDLKEFSLEKKIRKRPNCPTFSSFLQIFRFQRNGQGWKQVAVHFFMTLLLIFAKFSIFVSNMNLHTLPYLHLLECWERNNRFWYKKSSKSDQPPNSYDRATLKWWFFTLKSIGSILAFQSIRNCMPVCFGTYLVWKWRSRQNSNRAIKTISQQTSRISQIDFYFLIYRMPKVSLGLEGRETNWIVSFELQCLDANNG